MATRCQNPLLSGFRRLCSSEVAWGSAKSPVLSSSARRHHISGATAGLAPAILSRSRSANLPSTNPTIHDAVLSRIPTRTSSGVAAAASLRSPVAAPRIWNSVSGFLASRNFSSRSSIKLPPFPAAIESGTSGLIIRRFFSIKAAKPVRFSGELKKSLADRSLSAASSAVSRYREAAGLHLEAFWSRNYLVVVGAGALATCIALWRIMFGIASTFVGLSEGMAKYGFLALASAMVAFAGIYLRSRFSINPDKIYRIAMRKLNTSSAILEVMGAPLTGTDVRAYVMSGSGAKLKNFKMRLGGKRCFLIFPIRGSERKGLVSVEVKKKKGQYDMKLLAVDIPMAAGDDQRVFLIGNEEEYRVGGGLISELRDPIVKAMAAEKEFEVLDEMEEEEDEARELEELERKRSEEEDAALRERQRQQELAERGA